MPIPSLLNVLSRVVTYAQMKPPALNVPVPITLPWMGVVIVFVMLHRIWWPLVTFVCVIVVIILVMVHVWLCLYALVLEVDVQVVLVQCVLHVIVGGWLKALTVYVNLVSILMVQIVSSAILPNHPV